MNKKQIKTIQEIILEFQNDYSFENKVEVKIEKKDTKETIIEKIRETNEDGKITDKEILYYSEAMSILSTNDNTLTESLEIAADYGFALDKLNSCILASLLLSRRNQDDFEKYIERIGEYIDDLLSNNKKQ